MREVTKKAIEILAGLTAAAGQTEADALLGPMFKNLGLTTEEIVRRALDGDLDAHLFLCREAGAALEKSQAMPRLLEAYASKVLLDEFSKAKRGRGRRAKWMQNYAIVQALELLSIDGIPPTRNEATDPDLECGCRIVAEIFSEVGKKIGEPGVEKVYQNRRKILAPLAKVSWN
jgi:hypothetical protein